MNKSIPIIAIIVLMSGNMTTQYTTEQPFCNDNTRLIGVFSWIDYLVLGSMLIVSCGIGFFYGFCGSKQVTGDDFLLGGSEMKTLPMALSLAASFITAIELLGNPAEMYTSGLQFWMICLSFIIIVPITSTYYLPVFMKLRLTSSYEYLSLRFDPVLRYFSSAIYVLQMLMYTGIAVYAPALALSKIIYVNTYLAVGIVYTVCIFYASQGGLKAVIIADTFQAVILVGSIVTIAVLGDQLAGGFNHIWSTNYLSNRIEIFNFDTSPYTRHSFWSVVVGGSFYWLTMFCSNQASIQKYLSVEKMSQVNKALWISCVGLILIYTVNFYTGMILVTHYKNCDPIKSGKIENGDQLLPFFLISELGHLKGLSGLFLAGIFAASLGTVASALNSLAAVTLEDLLKDGLQLKLSEEKRALYGKWLSTVYGLISFCLIFVIETLGSSILQIAISFNGIVGGVTLGLFTLGMLIPWANKYGAIIGSLTSFVIVTWLGIRSQMVSSGSTKTLKFNSIDQCNCQLNSTFVLGSDNLTYDNSQNSGNHEISYLWYSMIGTVLTVVIGVFVSYVTGFESLQDIDKNLISPPVWRLIEKYCPEKSPKHKESLKILNNSNFINSGNGGEKDGGIYNIAIDISDEYVSASAMTKL